MSGHRYTVQATLHMVTSLNAIILIVILVTYNVIISRYYLTSTARSRPFPVDYSIRARDGAEVTSITFTTHASD